MAHNLRAECSANVGEERVIRFYFLIIIRAWIRMIVQKVSISGLTTRRNYRNLITRLNLRAIDLLAQVTYVVEERRHIWLTIPKGNSEHLRFIKARAPETSACVAPICLRDKNSFIREKFGYDGTIAPNDWVPRSTIISNS